jgi:hypothetical protein
VLDENQCSRESSQHLQPGQPLHLRPARSSSHPQSLH